MCNETGNDAVDEIRTWIETFAELRWIVTYEGPHFVCDISQQLKLEFNVDHHFTTVGWEEFPSGADICLRTLQLPMELPKPAMMDMWTVPWAVERKFRYFWGSATKPIDIP